MLRVLALGGAAGGLAASIGSLDESSNDTLRSAASHLNASRRFASTTVEALHITALYKWRLRGLERGTEAYAAARDSVHERAAQRLLRLCQANGGVYIKAGQQLATMHRVVPRAYTEALSVLQNDAPQSPLSDVIRVVERDLGRPFPELFAAIDPVPVGSASLAQVYRALSHDGHEVAVKVQHPGLRQQFDGDVRTFRMMARMLHWVFPDFDMEFLVPEFERTIGRELDFELEGHNAEAMEECFRGNDAVYVPRIFWHLSSKRVLAMEFVRGAKITDVSGLVERGLHPPRVAAQVSDVFNQQIFVHGRVHCDPHPGNILVRALPGGVPQIVLLDHGLSCELTTEFRRSYCLLWRALVFGDEAEVQRAATDLGAARYFRMLAVLLTLRAWNPKGRSLIASERSKMTPEERKLLREQVHGKASDLTELLADVPFNLLMVLKTSSLVRGIGRELGSTQNRFTENLRYAISGLSDSRSRWATWADQVRVGLLSLLLPLMSMLAR